MTDGSAVGADAGWPGRCTLDSSARLLDDGRIVIGGSPLRILRLTGRGAALVRRLAQDSEVPDRGEATAVPAASSAASNAGETALLRRLLDAGIAHPHPTGGPFAARDVTVVVPAFGRPQSVARTLAALISACRDVSGIIVVDDGSSPALDTHLAEGSGEGHCPIRLIRLDRNRGPAAARNAGLAQATTPLVAFVDSGCEPSAGWLEALLPHFGDPVLALAAPRITALTAPADTTSASPDAVSDAPRRDSARESALARYEAARSPLDLGPEPAPIVARTRVSYVPAAALLGRVDALRSVGGFDESLRVGEDVDLLWRVASADRSPSLEELAVAGTEGSSRGANWSARYEPAATVGHDHRTTFAAWSRRRVDYGTSAALLARRHPGSLAPVGVSGWSAGAWALAAAGHPVAGLAVAGATTALLTRKLGSLPNPWGEAVRLGGRGHLGAGRVLAAALRREWWPVAVGAAIVSKRARRAVIAAAIVPTTLDWWHDRPPLDPVAFAALRLADDLAYGTGVWLGCIAERTIAPLRPDFRNWPGRSAN